MKKLFLPILLLALAITLTACGGTVKNTEDKKSDGKSESVQKQMANEPASSERTEGNKANIEGQNSDGKASDIKSADKSTVSGNRIPNGEVVPIKNSIGIITKSDNAVSSAEKEKVLKDLDNEVSGMLKDIDKLDEVSDADLAE